MVGENLKNIIGDRPSVIRDLANRVDGPLSERRNEIPMRVARNLPSFNERNFGGGFGIGYVAAAVAVILEDTVGIPFGADADVINVETDGDTFTYTIDVNSPFPKMAEARGAIDSSTGFTSVLTEKIDILSAEKIKERPVRDTYRVEVRIS